MINLEKYTFEAFVIHKRFKYLSVGLSLDNIFS